MDLLRGAKHRAVLKLDGYDQFYAERVERCFVQHVR
jgi:hypothetical protein